MSLEPLLGDLSMDKVKLLQHNVPTSLYLKREVLQVIRPGWVFFLRITNKTLSNSYATPQSRHECMQVFCVDHFKIFRRFRCEKMRQQFSYKKKKKRSNQEH